MGCSLMVNNYTRKLVEEDMPTLPEGYYFKVTRPFLGYQEVQLKRKRTWWFGGKTLADRTHQAGYLVTSTRVVNTMHEVMRVHGGDEALAADQGPKMRLIGRYAKRSVPMLPIVANPDHIKYDEGTQTFTLSEEILERLKNGI